MNTYEVKIVTVLQVKVCDPCLSSEHCKVVCIPFRALCKCSGFLLFLNSLIVFLMSWLWWNCGLGAQHEKFIPKV